MTWPDCTLFVSLAGCLPRRALQLGVRLRRDEDLQRWEVRSPGFHVELQPCHYRLPLSVTSLSPRTKLTSNKPPLFARVCGDASSGSSSAPFKQYTEFPFDKIQAYENALKLQEAEDGALYSPGNP